MGNELLTVKNLETEFIVDRKVSKAVGPVSLRLNRGEIIGIVGESGSGKSVTMMSVLQLIQSPGRVAAGEAYLEGSKDNILRYDAQSEQMREIRGGKIGMIFQEPMTSLNPVLTIGRQISETIILHLHLSEAEAKARAIEMLKMVRIPDAESRYNYYPQQFSGGMRQRIMIAMAMAAEPTILIADEATTALDVTTQAQLLEMMRDIAKQTNTAIVIVTHNLGVVARYAERIYVMYSGRMVEHAPTDALFANPSHPYTMALLKAIPRLDDKRDRKLVPIEGLPPNPISRPDYCAFYDRCEFRCERCRKSKAPLLREIGQDHQIACILSDEERREKAEELRQRTVQRTGEKRIGDQNVLVVQDLKKYFPVVKGILRKKVGEVQAIEDVCFTLRQGETLGIVGESGCGKTTLARCVIRAYAPTDGTIQFNGTDIAKLNDRALAPFRPQISMIFQDPFSSLDPRQTAGDIIGEPLVIHKLCRSHEEYKARVEELMRMVGLDPVQKTRFPHEFSGGQRQRIGIARALASNPSMIICDEAISALDVSIQAQIINLLEELQAELGVSYLFIAHDLAVVKHISDRILVMYLGRVVEIADCDDIYENPLHPYTKTLIAAVPVADPAVEKQRTRIAVRGEVPSIMHRPKGCPFSDRCDYATDRCREQVPQLKEIDGRHSVACHLF